MTSQNPHHAWIRVSVEAVLLKATAFSWAAFPILPVPQTQIRPKLTSQSEDRPSEFPSHATLSLVIQ